MSNESKVFKITPLDLDGFASCNTYVTMDIIEAIEASAKGYDVEIMEGVFKKVKVVFTEI